MVEQVKASKDRAQAAALFQHLLAERPGDLELAFDRLEAKGLHQRVARIVHARLSEFPDLLRFIERRSAGKHRRVKR